jgi:DNA-binding IclR family transcriptional regulator
VSRRAKPSNIVPAEVQSDRRFVLALSRGLDVLSCFSNTERWLPNREIARRTGLPKATVSRLTFTLTSLGYLEHSAEREMYALGLPTIGLGFRVLSHFDIGRIARPFMQTLADEAQAAVSLGVRHGSWVIYVTHCRSTSPLTLGLDVGARLPLTRSVIGRTILATLNSSDLARVCGVLREEDPSNWPATLAGIETAQRDYQAHGFVVSEAAEEIGVVSAPLHIAGKDECLGLSCGGPARQLTPARLRRELGPRLRETIASIEQALRA